MSAGDYYALSAQARQRAFTVSAVSQLQVVEQVFDSLERAIEYGEDAKSWKARIGPELIRHWGARVADTEGRLDTIIRTNVQTAFSHGRHKQLTHPTILQQRPYWMLSTVQDYRTSDICRPLEGVILRADDPRWNRLTPPFHHRCRTRIRALRESQAKLRERKRLPEDFEPADGFGAPPAGSEQLAQWTPDWSKHRADLAAAAKEKAEQARKSAIEREARERPFTKEEFDALAPVSRDKLESFSKEQMAAGRAAKGESEEIGSKLTESELEAVKGFSYGFDTTIRRIQLGDLDDEGLFAWRRKHVEAKRDSETEAETREHIAKARKYRAALESALEKARGSQSSVDTVYRGMGGFSGSDIRRMLASGTVTMRGQTSSSGWYPGNAFGFEQQNRQRGTFGVVLRLRTRNGAPIEEMSEFPEEHELLLRGDMQFRITGVDRVDHDAGDTLGTVLITAEEIAA